MLLSAIQVFPPTSTSINLYIRYSLRLPYVFKRCQIGYEEIIFINNAGGTLHINFLNIISIYCLEIQHSQIY